MDPEVTVILELPVWRLSVFSSIPVFGELMDPDVTVIPVNAVAR